MNLCQVNVIEEFFRTLSSELATLIPKIILAVIIVIVTYLSLRILGYVLKKLLGLADIDGMFKKYVSEKIPISFNKLIIILVYVGVILASIYSLSSIFLPHDYMTAVSSFILYVTRIVSVAVMTLILFVIFSLLIEKMQVSDQIRGFILFITMLLLITMLIDVTALSESVKQSLYIGLSIGVGALLTVFAIWFFFHQYLEKWLTAERKKK